MSSKVAMSRSNKSLATVRLPDGKTDLLYYYDADNNLAQYMIAEGSAEGVSQTVLLNGKEIPGPGTIVGANPSNHLAACGGSFKGLNLKVYYVDTSGKLRELISGDGGKSYGSGALDGETNLNPTEGGSFAANISQGQDDPTVFVFDRSGDGEHALKAHWDGGKWSVMPVQ